jgi:hypothetical protein
MLFWRKGPSYPNNTLLAIFHSSSDRCKCFVVEAAAAAYTYNPYFLAIVSGADVGGSVRWCLWGVGEEKREDEYGRDFGEEDVDYCLKR